MPELRQRRSGCPRSTPFRQHRDVLSKSPAPPHALAGQARAWMPELRQRRSGCPMPGKRQAGCRFLLATSLLDKQKRGTSRAAGARNALELELELDSASNRQPHKKSRARAPSPHPSPQLRWVEGAEAAPTPSPVRESPARMTRPAATGGPGQWSPSSHPESGSQPSSNAGQVARQPGQFRWQRGASSLAMLTPPASSANPSAGAPGW